MSDLPNLSLYIHIPWCMQKCFYCDFNSYELKKEIPSITYVQHLLHDLKQDLLYTLDRKISTIFIGGGTPSLMSINAIHMLMDGVRNILPLIEFPEITIETNPGNLNSHLLMGYQQAGINRISIGVQSFNSQNLISLGRIHNAKTAKRAVLLTSKYNFSNLNLDLIYGLPDQSLKGALNDLNHAINLHPSHLSWYQLTIEPNTLFHSRPPKLPKDDIIWEIFEHGHQVLIKSGYKQYEISSYAKPGYFCKHNLNYWRFNDYLGIGCGAHGKLTQSDGRIIRTIKNRKPYSFMKGNYLEKKEEVYDSDKPLEFFMNRFRLIESLPRKDLYRYTKVNEKDIRCQIDKAIEMGFLLEDSNFWSVTRKGQLFLNSLLEIFLDYK